MEAGNKPSKETGSGGKQPAEEHLTFNNYHRLFVWSLNRRNEILWFLETDLL